MGSVKDLIKDDSIAGKLFIPPTAVEFGQGAWKVSGRFSVGDLKELIPTVSIKNKAEALTMMTAAFFEYLSFTNPEILTCYLGLLDGNGKIVDTTTLLDRGETSSIIVMRLAHVPESFCGGDLKRYRVALQNGELQCGVADVESIFRAGFPLGSSAFEKIFEAVDMKREYETLATYDEVTGGLDRIRLLITAEGLTKFPALEKIISKYKLEKIPNPGFVLKRFSFDSTTKFEKAGDRPITKDEERVLSGLSNEGYHEWAEETFPTITKRQIAFGEQKNLLNIDGKAECVAYHGLPVVTDFLFTVDENRIMIILDHNGEKWAIPSNKEIQRAIYRQNGVYAAIAEAKRRAEEDCDKDSWRAYFPTVRLERRLDIRGITEHSCKLMAYAIGEVANRVLGKNVFETRPLAEWTPEFMPYASKIERQR